MNEIAKIEGESWDQLKEKASMLVRSGFLPVGIRTPEQAICIALAGKELGIGLMESFRSIHVIQGKPTISPQLMLALANRTGELEDIQIDSKADKCIVTITRKGKKPHTETFGVPEATRLGLITRDQYQKQPSTMFKWRSLAACLRVTFPDVLLGLYTPEEIGADIKIINDDAMEVAPVQSVTPQIVDQTQSYDQPQPKPDILELKSIVFDAQAKLSKNINQRTGKPSAYFIIQDYQKQNYSTFDKKIYEFAKEAMADKSLCIFRYRSEGRFLNLVELLNVTIEEESEEDKMAGTAQEPVEEAEIVEG